MTTLNPHQQLPITLPFTLELPNQQSLILLESLRYLPNKRLVCRAELNDQTVLVKMYFGSKAKALMDSEQKHIQKLTQFEIKTQSILASHSIKPTKDLRALTGKDSVHILITKWLNDSVTLRDAWQHADETEKHRLFSQSLRLLAQHHRYGVTQTDLHMGNFLLSQDQLFTIDCDSISFTEEALGHKAALQQLGIWLAQASLPHDLIAERCLTSYFSERGWHLTAARQEKILAARAQQRAKILSNVIGKTTRECTSVGLIENKDHTLYFNKRAVQQSEIKDFCQTIPQLFAQTPESERLKNGGKVTAIKSEFKSQDVAIKRYNSDQQCKRAPMNYYLSRARCSWVYANVLYFFTQATPQPLALYQNIKTKENFFITRFSPGENLYSVFYERDILPQETINGVVKQVTAIFRYFKALKISHGDTKATNFFFEEGKVLVFDFDGTRQYPFDWWFRIEFKKDLLRFLKNFDEKPEIKALFKAAFVQAQLL